LITVEVRNNLHVDIIVEKILGRFVESSPVATFESDFMPVRICGGCSELLTVNFQVPLSCALATNRIKLGIRYGKVGFPLSVPQITWPESLEAVPFIIVNRIPMRKMLLFISHKAPQNTSLGTDLEFLFGNVGLTSYLAEKDDRPGLSDYWKDKILPKIVESVAMVVLWTLQVQAEPDNVLKEISYAKDTGTPRYVLLAKGANPGDVFPRNKVEHLSFDPALPLPALCKLVMRVCDDINKGVLPRKIIGVTKKR